MIAAAKIILVVLLAATATAQYRVSAYAGMINYAEGVFYIDQELQKYPEARFSKIPPGKSLRTEKGMVELLLGLDAFLWLGEKGAIQIENPSLADTELRVERGSVVLALYEKDKKNNLSIRVGGAIVSPQQPGLYRLDSERQQLSVYSGKAEIRLAGKKAIVKSGKAALIAGEMKTSRFDMRQTDRLQETAANRSQLLGRVVKQAKSKGLEQTPERAGWSDGWTTMENETMRRLETERIQNLGRMEQQRRQSEPVQWDGVQEGHIQDTQRQQAIQDAIDRAQSSAPETPPPNAQPQQ